MDYSLKDSNPNSLLPPPLQIQIRNLFSSPLCRHLFSSLFPLSSPPRRLRPPAVLQILGRLLLSTLTPLHPTTRRLPASSSRLLPQPATPLKKMLNNEREAIGDSIDVTKVTPHEDDKGHEKKRSLIKKRLRKALAFMLMVDELPRYVNFVG
ncbi:uncharacterized protein LOC121776828 [Salvia splendens]|uniref:uncharacterized protein LOC121776828 n=1 Tax=Salvia splendens TaxID=180675 RepID=UPI001C273F0E|nr:uncharacterized protein LOC121776828 [Salvia splendens]